VNWKTFLLAAMVVLGIYAPDFYFGGKTAYAAIVTNKPGEPSLIFEDTLEGGSDSDGAVTAGIPLSINSGGVSDVYSFFGPGVVGKEGTFSYKASGGLGLACTATAPGSTHLYNAAALNKSYMEGKSTSYVTETKFEFGTTGTLAQKNINIFMRFGGAWNYSYYFKICSDGSIGLFSPKGETSPISALTSTTAAGGAFGGTVVYMARAALIDKPDGGIYMAINIYAASDPNASIAFLEHTVAADANLLIASDAAYGPGFGVANSNCVAKFTSYSIKDIIDIRIKDGSIADFKGSEYDYNYSTQESITLEDITAVGNIPGEEMPNIDYDSGASRVTVMYAGLTYTVNIRELVDDTVKITINGVPSGSVIAMVGEKVEIPVFSEVINATSGISWLFSDSQGQDDYMTISPNISADGEEVVLTIDNSEGNLKDGKVALTASVEKGGDVYAKSIDIEYLTELPGQGSHDTVQLTAEELVKISERIGETVVVIKAGLQSAFYGSRIVWSVEGFEGASLEHAQSVYREADIENRLIIDNNFVSDTTDLSVTVKAKNIATGAADTKNIHIFAVATPDRIKIKGNSVVTVSEDSSYYFEYYTAEVYQKSKLLSGDALRFSEPLNWLLKTAKGGVSINADTGMLTVSSSASAGTVTIVAQMGNLIDEFNVSITKKTGSQSAKSSQRTGVGLAGVQVPGIEAAEEIKENSQTDVPQDKRELKDYRGHWCEEIINDLLSRRIINGGVNGEMRPDYFATKEETIKVLINILNISLQGGGRLKEGDNTSEWAVAYVLTAMDEGIVRGDETGFINGGGNVSRAEVCAMTSRALKLLGGDIGLLNTFSDGDKVPDWCKEDMAALISKKIITGFEDSTIRPYDLITRAEVFAIAYRAAADGGLI